MTRLFPHGRWNLGALALLLVCVIELPDARGQSDPPVQAPIVLDRDQASRLVLREVVPDYPALAKVNYIQGVVRLELVVASDGQVERAHVILGNPLLAAAALQAAQAWRYRPYKTPTGPRPFLTSVEIRFQLRNARQGPLPPEAERDFNRQVTPPEVASRSGPDSGESVVRLRLLLNDDGQVIDTEPLRGSAGQLGAALKSLARWTFRPARWGTIHLPWYLIVEVATASAARQQVAADPAPH